MFFLKKFRLLPGLICLCGLAQAQTFTLTGRVTDARSGEPIPFASVALKGTTFGTTTTFEGIYKLTVKQLADSLLVTSVGYKARTKPPGKTALQNINFQLEPVDTELQEVVVTNGENPAFEILRQVRDKKGINDKKRLAAYQYEAYNKTEIDVDNLSDKFKEKKMIKKITKVIDEFDRIAGEDGKPVLPMFVSESVSDVYYVENPQRRKEFIRKSKISGVGVKDGSFVSQLIGNSFQDYNFYNNYLIFLNKEFASPIGESWKSLYDWYLADSLMIGERMCYEMEFEPKHKQDLAFKGRLWIDKATFALTRIDATITKEANLNYIDKIKIQQELEPTPEGAWLPIKSRMLYDIAEVSKNTAGMLAKFYTSNRNFVVNQPKDLKFFDFPVEVADDVKEKDPAYWEKARHEPLSKEETQALAMIDSVRNIPIVRTYVEIADLAVNGWKKWGKLDFGPYLYVLATNPVEGLRMRMGFRTNADFSKKWVFRGLLAYGTRDGIVKYQTEANYIFSRRKWTVLGVSHAYDVERVGITNDIAGNNKLFYAFTRFGSRGSFYQTENRIFLKTEPVKGIILSAALAGQHFNPVGLPYYNFGYYPNPPAEGDLKNLRREFQDIRLETEVRLARHEIYLMDGNERITVGTKRVPVFTFRYIRGFQGFLGGDFAYDKFQFNAFQTIRMGQFGRSNYRFSFGYTPSTIPYPLLFTHLGGGRRNPLYNRFSFNMMGFFEFVSDEYASLMWDHSFEGWLFNRIPLVRKLKWRLVASANILYGSQRLENRNVVPSTDSQKEPILEFNALNPDIPYAEIGYGIDNIFKIFRIQAIHRLTYLDQPGTRSFAIKGAFHFSF
jgi:hypothetical protein